MIAWDDEDRHATVGDAPQRFVRLIRDRWDDRRPIENVAGMHDEIDLSGHRRLERSRVVRKKIEASSPPANARPYGEIEAQVRIGEQENPDVVGHSPMVRPTVFVR